MDESYMKLWDRKSVMALVNKSLLASAGEDVRLWSMPNLDLVSVKNGTNANVVSCNCSGNGNYFIGSLKFIMLILISTFLLYSQSNFWLTKFGRQTRNKLLKNIYVEMEIVFPTCGD